MSMELLMAAAGSSGPKGQQLFTTPGSFTVPAGVTSISGVFVGKGAAGINAPTGYGGGDGGPGGNLRYINNLPVTPGEVLSINIDHTGTWLARGGTVIVKASSGAWRSSTVDNTTLGAGAYGGVVGGATGGVGGSTVNSEGGGGGGASGYSGNGGKGRGNANGAATAGAGGGGGGGWTWNKGAGGGGVGLYGEGASGAAGTTYATGAYGGGGGSGGSSGATVTNVTDLPPGAGGEFGGGGGGGTSLASGSQAGGAGGPGGARIIWGEGRSFPSTMTGDVI